MIEYVKRPDGRIAVKREHNAHFEPCFPFDGVLLPVSEIAARTGLRVPAVLWRARNGRDLTTPKLKHGGVKPKRFNYRADMLTVQEIAQATGQSISAVYKNTNGERYFEPHERTWERERPGNEYLLTYEGETLNITQWAKRKGLTRAALSKRISTPGWTLEEALETPVRRGPKITFNGETHTLNYWARRLGMSNSALENRLEKVALAHALKMPVLSQAQRARNEKVLARMAQAFNHPADGTASAEETATGGPSQTSPDAPATGLGKDNLYLHEATP